LLEPTHLLGTLGAQHGGDAFGVRGVAARVDDAGELAHRCVGLAFNTAEATRQDELCGARRVQVMRARHVHVLCRRRAGVETAVAERAFSHRSASRTQTVRAARPVK